MNRLLPAAGLFALLLSPLAAEGQTVAPDSLRADSLQMGTAWNRAGGFDALPVRSVRGVAAWAPGIRRDLATGALIVRARSGDEPRFVLDGARQLGGIDMPFETVQSVRVLTEGVPARYGQAAGGLVVVDTDPDADRVKGRLEAYSSRATDAYGADLGALTVRAPLGALGGFELAGEVGRQLDASPWGIGAVQLTDEAFARVQANPQSVYVREGEAVRAVPFPYQAALASESFTDDDLRRELGLAADAEILPGLVPTVETLGADGFERRAAKDDPLDDLRLAAGLTLRPTEGVTLRTTGRLDRQRADRASFTSALMNPDARNTAEQNGFGLATSLNHSVTPTLQYNLRGSIERDEYLVRPFGFSDGIEDVLLYGDIDHPSAEIAQRYVVFSGFNGEYRRQFTEDGGARPGQLFGTYSLPGRQNFSQYLKGERGSVQVGGSVHVDLGAHQLELGGEFEQQTYRLFSINGFGLAAFVNDGSVENQLDGFPNGIDRYDQLPYALLRNRTTRLGYSFNGLATADSEDIDAFYDNDDISRSSKDVAPFQPRSMAGYAETRSTLGPVEARIGLRLEGYDPNGNQLFDPWAPLPIRRAGDLTTGVPEGIGEDYAVYFDGFGQRAVGFRDLDGQFYDAQGTPTSSNEIIVDQQAQVVEKEGALRSEAFRDAPTVWSLEPRVHLAFQATGTLGFFASAERLSRRPDPSLHVSLQTFDNLSSLGFRVGSVAPEFETVDAARLGVALVASPTLSGSVAGFLRQTRGLPEIQPLAGSFPRYGATFHTGGLDEIGVDVAASWRPLSEVSVQVGYTLASAKGSIANATAVTNIIWRAGPGDPFPSFMTPASNDTRHALDVIATARVPESAGPWFGGFGGGLVLSAQSGLPYTRLVPNSPNQSFGVFDSFTTEVVGSVNSARLPWTHQLDLRLDRQISIGMATVELFAWIQNVLGAENVLALYRGTGQPDDDGYIAAQPDRFGPEQRALYQAYISGPVNVGGSQSTSAPFFYGQPRQIRIGLRASF